MGPTKSLDGPGYKKLSARLYYNNNILYALQLHGLLMVRAGMFSQPYSLTAPTSLLNRTPTSLPDCTPSRAYPTVQPEELTRTLYHFNQLPWIKKKRKKFTRPNTISSSGFRTGSNGITFMRKF